MLQVAQVAPLELFSLQSDTSRTLAYVYDVFDVFGAPKRVWALETRFRATFALRRPKTIKKRRTRMKKKGSTQDWVTLALLELQKRTWRPMEPGWLAGRPAGRLAGWLAEAEAENVRITICGYEDMRM